MTEWAAVERYLVDTVVHPDEALTAAVQAAAAAGMPAIEVTPTQGKLLMLLATIQGARRVGHKVTIHVGAALETLPTLTAPYDLFSSTLTRSTTRPTSTRRSGCPGRAVLSFSITWCAAAQSWKLTATKRCRAPAAPSSCWAVTPGWRRQSSRPSAPKTGMALRSRW